MKGRDNKFFWVLLFISALIGYFIFDTSFDAYSDIITFLSIMIGFQITSLSILFNSPLKKDLYDKKIEKYETELHRLKDFYKHAMVFEVISILIIFIMTQNALNIPFKNFSLELESHLLVCPILMGASYCFLKILFDLLRIFVHPTND